MGPVRVLVVDDSAFMRMAIRRILEEAPDIKVVDVARDGVEAVEKAVSLQPDVVTLDINMPRMDGLTALFHITAQTRAKVVMISSLTQEDALTTLEALHLGAVDFVPKPDGTVSLGIGRLAREIVDKVRAAARARTPVRHRHEPVRKERHTLGPALGLDRVVFIGVSTGGPQTLEEILPELPADLAAAVIVVQHMPPRFTSSLAARLDQYCRLTVREAEEGMEVHNGLVLVAPGGQHLLFRRQGGKLICRLSHQPEDSDFKPSVGVTLQALMAAFDPRRTIGVMLTGMGDDGADAMAELRRRGGWTVVESEETAVVWGMPRATIERGGADAVEPSYRIAETIWRKVGSR
ncbi:MAG: two-component system, chemotaxis family, protein-glutamate methylesterase/glutaminase [Bacillota bacterium]|jgi:two-component system chemotaxis response regulator CheB|nr:two-component system, chemotaxis family, protein-glutamate methylesterase/glutaminase [Bacillota bacterium]MDK2925264.1 two-component system, chemotaxis family, protein-glutamate methylesterase/glutaminase [Bacillota bacterium]MDK2960464.1 two-component system, chemotaxis family, protein-glutamate methylesterase/glutaminase [Bacillota bacterium]